MTDLMTILASLQKQGVDTAPEMLLLRQKEKAGEQPILLVTGDEPGRPLDLMKGLGMAPLCPPGQFLPYPVQCIYGDTLTLTATDSRGEHHHFYDIPSFLAHCGGDVKMLTVTSDAPILRRAAIRIITVTDDTLADLGRLAGDCSGVVLTLDCSAGAPEPVEDVSAEVGDTGDVQLGVQGQWVCPLSASVQLPAGIYPARVTVESYSPLQLIFGAGQTGSSTEG